MMCLFFFFPEEIWIVLQASCSHDPQRCQDTKASVIGPNVSDTEELTLPFWQLIAVWLQGIHDLSFTQIIDKNMLEDSKLSEAQKKIICVLRHGLHDFFFFCS